MYLMQDSTEALWTHRQRGFTEGDALLAYVEFWGVMQAVIIQQDSINELHEVIVGDNLDTGQLIGWHRLRDLRNECAGPLLTHSRKCHRTDAAIRRTLHDQRN